MGNKKLIKPYAILKLNQCPECMGRLKLIEEETSISSVDEGGVPIMENSLIDVTLYCIKCNKEYKANKKGVIQ